MKRTALALLLVPAMAFAQARGDDDDDDAPPPAAARQQPAPPGRAQKPGEAGAGRGGSAAPTLQQPYGSGAPGQYAPNGGQYPPGQYPPNGGQYPYAPNGGQYPPGQYPASGGQYPYPPSGGQYPPGQYAPNGGQYPSQYPPGQYAPNGGQYPPQYPPGQYAPNGGQYPPGQYAPNGGQAAAAQRTPATPTPPGSPPPTSRPTPAASPPPPAAPAAPPAARSPSTPPPAVEPPSAFGTGLVLSSASEPARAAAIACADALDNFHLDTARERCRAALAADDGLAVAHLWLSQSAPAPEVAAAELQKAVERAARATPGERLLVDGWRAYRETRLADAQRAYDELVRVVPAEKRAWVARGQLRQVALGDVEGAIADYRQAAAVDPRYAAAHNFLGFALADAGRWDEAMAALRKYGELAPQEPNAHDSLAAMALRSGDLAEAISEEKRALTLDPRFLVAHATLGDALLLQGRARDAHREYAFLMESDDAALHHEGALRDARAWLFEERNGDAELALVKEAAAARKAKRAAEAAETFLHVVRIQIERGALAEAGRGLREAAETLKAARSSAGPSGAPVIDDLARRRLTAELTLDRALALASLNERGLAEQRADELAAQLRVVDERHAAARAREVRGWIAWRVGDDKAAVASLDKASLPTMRYAGALALARSGDAARARAVMEDLARRNANDLETALTRPRALAWLKSSSAAAAR